MTNISSITIEPISALKDNYIWAITDNTTRQTIIVDPGEAKPVIDYLNKHKLSLIGILITHHHWDHMNGVGELVKKFNVPVYGSAKEIIPHITHALTGVDKVKIHGFPIEFEVLDIPAHTNGHIAYYAPGILFSGDTLFAAGCGRVFEGTHEQMFTSLQKMATLPDETKLYCGHEYTLKNLQFATTVEPSNKNILERIKHVAEVRNKNLPSLPSTLAEEKATNPFLRCDSPEIKATVEKHNHVSLKDALAVFTALRNWKDEF